MQNIVLEHKTKAELVFETLRDAIVNGELEPGSKIVIREIAGKLGVSEIPVREALKRLEAEGMIALTPYVGAVVTAPSIEQLEEDMSVRSVLEAYAAKNSAPYLREEDAQRLEELLEAMRAAIEAKNYKLFSRLDREFHMVLYSRCKNNKLIKLIRQLWNDSERARSVFQIQPASGFSSYREHELMLNAIKLRDYNLLAWLVENQKIRVGKILKDYLEELPRK